MEGIAEFQDWELLHNSDTGFVYSPKTPDHSKDFVDVDGDSEGVIRSDYFSLDSETRYARTVAESDDDHCSDKSSVQSNNPSWVDPSSDDATNKVGFRGITFQRKNSGEFWSDSASDGSVSRNFAELDQKHVLGFADDDDDKREVGFEGIAETEGIEGKFSDSGGATEKIYVKIGSDDEGEVDSGSDNVVKIKNDLGFSPESNIVVEGEGGGDGLNSAEFVEGGEGSAIPEGIGNNSEESVNSIEGEKRGGIVWWKLPFELFKFCVFRVSPVWSISVAAAVVGFVILRRRLYKMKRKSQSFALKVTVEDKKASQFITRAARLNEAFLVVKRVPMIRPSLPAGGMTPWPVMSLR